MPEIWLSYGPTDVVIDVRAENLETVIGSEGAALSDEEIHAKLDGAGMAEKTDLAVLHDSAAVRKAVSSLFILCQQKSKPPPRILADPAVLASLRAGLPEGCQTAELGADPGKLVFVSEVEFDGLFGYETVATRLLRRFGGDAMLTAYAKRRGNEPAPGHRTGGLEEAEKFADRFEIESIELVAGSSGISDIVCGHPAKTGAAGMLESSSIREAGIHGSVVMSTGKGSSNATLSASLRSLWNCAAAVKKDGLAVLVAECAGGLGSDALRRHIEGRITRGQLLNPSKYVDGMEDLLFLSEAREKFQVALASVLPELYAKKLGIIPLAGAKSSLKYILDTRGARQKVMIVTDGARLLLR